jgi:predicted phosphoribosyltransferase
VGAVRVLSHSPAPFTDRLEAGRLLAAALEGRRPSRPVVLGIPRGGIVVAAEIADHLAAALDIVLARKIGAPSNPELAIGSIAEDGRLFLDERLAARLGASPQYVERERTRQIGEIARRVALYRAARPKVPLRGRVVIVADDGLATGATLQAALWEIRREQALLVIAAVPVGAIDTIERLAPGADELLCLRAPEDFGAVGRFYRQFDQVSDETVVAILERHRPATGPS